MVHPLAGRRQSPEHVARRVAAGKRTREAWSPAMRAMVAQKCAENAKKTPSWNRGNDWRSQYTPEEVRAIQADRARRRRARSPHRRLHESMSAQLRQSLRESKAGRSWEMLVGYTLADLRGHLEQQFAAGMSWENYGEWHIDHIRPRASFNYTTTADPDFRACWALENLQPLWAKDNLTKRARFATAQETYQP